MDLDLEELAALFELLDGAVFTEFRLDKGDLHIVVRRGPVTTDPASAEPPAAATQPPSPTVPTPAPSVVAPGRATAAVPAPTASAATPVPDVLDDQSVVIVRSPMLGTAYRAPRPGEQPFVAVGDHADPETTLCIVEVMKLMSSVPAGIHGEVVNIYFSDGDLVEVDQPLFAIRPAL